jgi:hypothetical protein
VDLSDKKKWKIQLEELGKLPAFARVGNFLAKISEGILFFKIMANDDEVKQTCCYIAA